MIVEHIKQELLQVNGLELYHDTQVLSEKLVDYFEEHVRGYQFNDFYDKQFIDNFKKLVKDEEHFMAFLKDISFTLDEFLNIAVYVCPHCFTSNLIKYIKTNYLKSNE